MNELLKEFWEAWKQWDRSCQDLKIGDSGLSNRSHRDVTWWRLQRAASRLHQAERGKPELPAGAHEDIPGQMYITDLPLPLPKPEAVDVRGVA